jgi:hypothetical protein
MSPNPASPLPRREDKLRHLPSTAQAAFSRWSANGDSAELDIVVFAIIEDFAPTGSKAGLSGRGGSARLVEDVGLDSLAITEIAFFCEDLFQFSISNDEIQQVRSIDDLRAFVRRKAGDASLLRG